MSKAAARMDTTPPTRTAPTPRRRAAAAALVAGVLCAVAWGCGGGGDTIETDKVTVQVYVADGTLTAAWQAVRVEVRTEQGGNWQIQRACSAYQPGGSIPLPELPYDVPLQVCVELFAEATCGDPATARGCSMPVTVRREDPTGMPIYVMVSSVGQFVPVSPATGTPPPTERQPRYGASVTPLPDGRVVIIGGAKLKLDVFNNPGADTPAWDDPNNIEEIYDTVEIYDPATGTFDLLSTDEASPETLFYRRAFHKAVYLPHSHLIAIVGGLHQPYVGDPITSVGYIELFDPERRVFLDPDIFPPLEYARVGADVNVLTYYENDGGVKVPVEYLFVTGGQDPEAQGTYEVYRVGATGGSRAQSGVLGAPQHVHPRWNHTAVLTTGSDGNRRVLLIGGWGPDGRPVRPIDIFLVDGEGAATFVNVPGFDAPAGLSTNGRVGHVAIDVPTGTHCLPGGVYVIGGWEWDDQQNKLVEASRIEVLNPDNGAPLNENNADVFSLIVPRALHAATLLPSGHILISGGVHYEDDALTMVVDNEVIGATRPPPGAAGDVWIQAMPVGAMRTPRMLHAVVPLPNEQAFVTGGLSLIDNTVNVVGRSTEDVLSELVVFDTYDPCMTQ